MNLVSALLAIALAAPIAVAADKDSVRGLKDHPDNGANGGVPGEGVSQVAQSIKDGGLVTFCVDGYEYDPVPVAKVSVKLLNQGCAIGLYPQEEAGIGLSACFFACVAASICKDVEGFNIVVDPSRCSDFLPTGKPENR